MPQLAGCAGFTVSSLLICWGGFFYEVLTAKVVLSTFCMVQDAAPYWTGLSVGPKQRVRRQRVRSQNTRESRAARQESDPWVPSFFVVFCRKGAPLLYISCLKPLTSLFSSERLNKFVTCLVLLCLKAWPGLLYGSEGDPEKDKVEGEVCQSPRKWKIHDLHPTGEC